MHRVIDILNLRRQFKGCFLEMSDSPYEFLNNVQDKLLDFYEDGKLTDVTWIVGPEDAEGESVHTHSSICVLSNYLKELLFSHPKCQQKRVIRLPPSITSSTSEFQFFLRFAYTGTIDQSLADYFHISILFDMPLGMDICNRSLSNSLHDMLLRPSIDQEGQESIRHFFAYCADKKAIRQPVLDFFLLHPLIFDTPSCLSKLPIEWALKAIKKGKLWIQHPDGSIYFGERYVSEASQFVQHLCAAHNIYPIKIRFPAENSMLAPLHTSKSTSLVYAHQAVVPISYSFFALRKRCYTHTGYPSNKWKISALTTYVTRSWNNRRVFAGLDVTYRNFSTNEERKVEWGHYSEEIHDIQTFIVPEGDFITACELSKSWPICALAFTTREGVSFDVLDNRENRTLKRINTSELGQNGETIIALHGFSYTDMVWCKEIMWANIKFHCSSINNTLLKAMNPQWETSILEFVKNKKIIF